jgi:hypothetical protein
LVFDLCGLSASAREQVCRSSQRVSVAAAPDTAGHGRNRQGRSEARFPRPERIPKIEFRNPMDLTASSAPSVFAEPMDGRPIHKRFNSVGKQPGANAPLGEGSPRDLERPWNRGQTPREASIARRTFLRASRRPLWPPVNTFSIAPRSPSAKSSQENPGESKSKGPGSVCRRPRLEPRHQVQDLVPVQCVQETRRHRRHFGDLLRHDIGFRHAATVIDRIERIARQ